MVIDRFIKVSINLTHSLTLVFYMYFKAGSMFPIPQQTIDLNNNTNATTNTSQLNDDSQKNSKKMSKQSGGEVMENLVHKSKLIKNK